MPAEVVSVILPVHNAASWLPDCLNSVLKQTYDGPLELSIFNDASTDSSVDLIKKWSSKFLEKDIPLLLSEQVGQPGGVGYARNKAIAQSSGTYLCFLDADDVMHEDRISSQLELTQSHPDALVGCKFHREPSESTLRFTEWANNLTADQLTLQVYTSNGPTVIMPTWFCTRQVVDSVGGFDESGKGTPEDLIFFFKHLENGGKVLRVDQDLLMYRYHPQAETFSISEETIWNHRVKFLEESMLKKWTKFSIWNAGKQGRKLYRSLSSINKGKVAMFCDVDEKKIGKKFYIYEESKEKVKPRIPIVHFSQVQPPIVICVKLKLSGNFEENLSSLKLEEGKDYIHFN